VAGLSRLTIAAGQSTVTRPLGSYEIARLRFASWPLSDGAAFQAVIVRSDRGASGLCGKSIAWFRCRDRNECAHRLSPIGKSTRDLRIHPARLRTRACAWPPASHD
jgi:hypothetical protein